MVGRVRIAKPCIECGRAKRPGRGNRYCTACSSGTHSGPAGRSNRYWRAHQRKVADKRRAKKHEQIPHPSCYVCGTPTVTRKHSLCARHIASAHLLRSARAGARGRNFAINITAADLEIPAVCPVLGIKLALPGQGKRTANTASVDRVDSSKGYVTGNVRVISWRANLLKRDGTLDELRRIARYVEEHISFA